MKHTRKQKLIQPSLQLSLTAAFGAFTVVAMLLQFLYLGGRVASFASELGAEGQEIVSFLPRLMLETLAASIFVVLPLLVWMGVHLTHRYAGPVYRLRRFLNEVAEGSETQEVRLRKRDVLHDLADAANRATAATRAANAEAGADQTRAA